MKNLQKLTKDAQVLELRIEGGSFSNHPKIGSAVGKEKILIERIKLVKLKKKLNKEREERDKS